MQVEAITIEQAEAMPKWKRDYMKQRGVAVPNLRVGRPVTRKKYVRGADYGCKRKARIAGIPEWKTWFRD